MIPIFSGIDDGGIPVIYDPPYHIHSRIKRECNFFLGQEYRMLRLRELELPKVLGHNCQLAALQRGGA